MSNNSNDILSGFAAETLLGSDAHVIKEIIALRDDLRYSSKGNEISLDDAFMQLQQAVDSLPSIVLDMDVPPGTENEYLIRLSTAQEKVLDDCDRVLRRILEYQSKLKNAERSIKKYKSDFMAWYILAASYVVAQHKVKFGMPQIKQLAEAEFTRLIDDVDVQVDNLISSVEHLTEEARQHKKIQSEKHGLGKDQANASWTSNLGNPNGIAPNRADDMAQVEEDEEEDEVPAFVSRSPQVGSASAVCGDAEAVIASIPEVVKNTKIVTSNQDLLDEAEPGDTVMLQFQDKVHVTETIRDTVKITGPATLPPATPEQVADFLNEDDAPKQAAVMAAGASTLKSRKRLILTEDEELM
jgi:ribosomal protein S15P/S13E